MATIDYEKMAQQKTESEAFNKLLDYLNGNNVVLSKDDLYNARGYILNLKLTIQKQEGEIKKYQEFFNKLSELLPKQFTINDKLY
jgi:hypothetical protein